MKRNASRVSIGMYTFRDCPAVYTGKKEFSGLLVLMSRNALRRRTLKGAQIVFNNRCSVIDCTVRNISATGALLALPNTTGVPDQFALHMESGRRVARVVWKSDRTVGVVWSTDAGRARQFDDETWQAIVAVAPRRGVSFQDLVDEAFADLLKKHKQAVGLIASLKESVVGSTPRTLGPPEGRKKGR